MWLHRLAQVIKIKAPREGQTQKPETSVGFPHLDKGKMLRSSLHLLRASVKPLSSLLKKKSQIRCSFLRCRILLRHQKLDRYSKGNTLAPFQTKVNTVLTKLGECSVALIDDIAVYSQTWEDHVEHVKQGFG
ncbi:hypothetical protein TREES_T100015702 [Tupaia chinensis]|uniref:Reverse transcriptase domain-containing protein n=1 Tax=Tupaia chinensis TaxID=246437 RepID=L9L776_TUPCH|nr:hypothetical protein TREES_T100015702 [Tupaia chinensis]